MKHKAIAMCVLALSLSVMTMLARFQTRTSAAPVNQPLDLQSMVADAQPGSTITLPAGDVPITIPLSLNKPGLVIDGQGKATLRKITAKAAGTSTMLDVTASNITIKGVTFDSDKPATLLVSNPKINVTALIVQAKNLTIGNCTFRNVDTGIECWAGQSGMTLNHVHATSEIRGDFFYGGGGTDNTTPRGNVLMMNTTIDESNQEHNIRMSCPAFSGLTCVNCSFHNGDGKEDVAPRQCHNLKFYNCTFNGQYPVFMGEGGSGKLTADQARAQCSGLEFHDCVLTHGGYSVRYAQDILIDGGCVLIDASAGDGNEYVAGIVSNGTNVTYQNVTRVVIGKTAKPLFRNNTGNATAVKDGGGNVTKNIRSTLARATQPANIPSN